MGRLAKTTPITLDGKERHLRYDFNALIALEEQTGINLADQEQIGSKSQFRVLRDLVWAGLLHEEPSLTREQVGAMLDLETLAQVNAAVVAAQKLSAPEQTEGADSPANPPNVPTGSDSGQSDATP